MTPPTKKRGGRFQPGTSGNAKGRPRGVGEIGKLRASISTHIPEILERLALAAKAGDVNAARILLEKTLPSLKPVESPAVVALPDGAGLTEIGLAVFEAVATGKLSPDQGRSMLAGLEVLSQLRAGDEFETRLQALEAAQNGNA
jgi:hypothetical protein